MIFTVLLYIREGMEIEFLEYENKVLPILSEYEGMLLKRIRHGFSTDMPYETHIISFKNNDQFQRYIDAPERKQYMHLAEEVIKHIDVFSGTEI